MPRRCTYPVPTGPRNGYEKRMHSERVALATVGDPRGIQFSPRSIARRDKKRAEQKQKLEERRKEAALEQALLEAFMPGAGAEANTGEGETAAYPIAITD